MSATPRTDRAALAASEAALLAAIPRSEAWAAEPSGLPGWSRKHVVAHLAGNAEGMTNLATWARTGTKTPMYASMEARKADIEARSQWSLDQLIDLLTQQVLGFAAACDDLTEPLGASNLALGSGAPIRAWELPMCRRREVEIHRVDLADGYTASDWPSDFTLRTMDQVVPFMRTKRTLPAGWLIATDSGRAWEAAGEGPELFGPEADLLAWLLGRPHQGLTVKPDQPVPPAPAWV